MRSEKLPQTYAWTIIIERYVSQKSVIIHFTAERMTFLSSVLDVKLCVDPFSNSGYKIMR